MSAECHKQLPSYSHMWSILTVTSSSQFLSSKLNCQRDIYGCLKYPHYNFCQRQSGGGLCVDIINMPPDYVKAIIYVVSQKSCKAEYIQRK